MKFNSLFFLLFLIVVFSCKQNEEPANQLISDNVKDGVVFVEHEDTGVSFRLETNNASKFFPSPTKPTFDISEDGRVSVSIDQGVYWIDIHWENGSPMIETVPVVIAKNIDFTQDAVSTLKNLKQNGNGYSLVFRHANATVGSDQVDSEVPEWWKSCDSDLARQLNNTGVERSMRIGRILKKLEVPITKALSSEFCRAVQTLELMELGLPLALDGRLNHENANPNPVNFSFVFDALRENQPETGTMIACAHYNLYSDIPFRSVIRPFNQSDGFLVKVNQTGDPELVGSLPYFLWDLFDE